MGQLVEQLWDYELYWYC